MTETESVPPETDDLEDQVDAMTADDYDDDDDDDQQ